MKKIYKAPKSVLVNLEAEEVMRQTLQVVSLNYYDYWEPETIDQQDIDYSTKAKDFGDAWENEWY